MGDVGVAGEGLGLEQAIHVDGVGAGLRNQAKQLGLAVAAAKDQPGAALPQGGVERAQGFVEPPKGGGAHGTDTGTLIEDVDGDNRPSGLRRVVEGRIVGQTQVLTEPQDHRSVVGLGGHACGLRDNLRTCTFDAT